MILTYRVLTTLFYPLFIILIIIRKILHKEDQFRYKEKIFTTHFNVVEKKNKKLLWFHAASIGEFKSIIPIIDELNRSNDNLNFLITTVTLSSSNLAKTLFSNYNNVYHRFFPIDVDFVMDKFLANWKPDVIFLVDSEIWPNLILRSKQKKIPLALINARITKKTFKKWIYFPTTAKKIFSSFDLCLTSNQETKNYLLKLEAKNVFYLGNLKLISKIEESKFKINIDILDSKRYWVAVSTHDGEDIFCLRTHLLLKEKYKDIITIIVPRHLNRINKIQTSCKNFNLNFQILEKGQNITLDKEVIIVNSFGVVQNFFKHAKSVFVGKSTIEKFKNVGGQNPIEAAKLNCKIYHGPYVYNFEEIYKILEKHGISKVVKNSKELSDNLINDLENSKKNDDKIGNIVNNLGEKTLIETMNNINKFLSNEIT